MVSDPRPRIRRQSSWKDALRGMSSGPDEVPIEERVVYKYGVELPRSGSALERQQGALSVAVAEADTRAGERVIGTRVTMTSRTGYFQDRIISPSMVSVCVLWRGKDAEMDR